MASDVERIPTSLGSTGWAAPKAKMAALTMSVDSQRKCMAASVVKKFGEESGMLR